MSSSQSFNFVVWAPDYTDDGAQQRRLAVREAHLENAHKLIQQGIIKLGGGNLTPESISGGEREFVGSTLLIQAASFDDVKQLIESDVYYVNNVWDKEKLVIVPFLLAAPAEWKL